MTVKNINAVRVSYLSKKDTFKNIYWMLTNIKRLLKMSTLLRSVCSVIGEVAIILHKSLMVVFLVSNWKFSIIKYKDWSNTNQSINQKYIFNTCKVQEQNE